MTPSVAPRLFVAPVDVRALTDAQRVILEAIDARGPISGREAGEIVYRLRGYRNLGFVRLTWLTSAGLAALRRLERIGLVRRARRGRWIRVEDSCSDLIGPSVARDFSSTLTTPKALKSLPLAGVTSVIAHAHDTSANRHFSGGTEPVTSSGSELGGLSSARKTVEAPSDDAREAFCGACLARRPESELVWRVRALDRNGVPWGSWICRESERCERRARRRDGARSSCGNFAYWIEDRWICRLWTSVESA